MISRGFFYSFVYVKMFPSSKDTLIRLTVLERTTS